MNMLNITPGKANLYPGQVMTMPRQRFTIAEIEAMPKCFGPEWAGRIAPEGFSLWRKSNGKLIVTLVSSTDWFNSYSVCPIIVRVPAGRKPTGKWERS